MQPGLLIVLAWCNRTQDFEKAGGLRDKEMELKATIASLTKSAKESSEAQQEAEGEGGPLVQESDIANIVSQWTGIPIEKVSNRNLSCRPSTSLSSGSNVPKLSHEYIIWQCACTVSSRLDIPLPHGTQTCQQGNVGELINCFPFHCSMGCVCSLQ